MSIISIHAPRAGSDKRPHPRSCSTMDFNPRSPCGERPLGCDPCEHGQQFQSTLPVRGATAGAREVVERSDFNPRSPCGERPKSYARGMTDRDFNPRSPCGERPSLRTRMESFGVISIHAPRAGSDGLQAGVIMQVLISIHAPRAGSDQHR